MCMCFGEKGQKESCALIPVAVQGLGWYQSHQLLVLERFKITSRNPSFIWSWAVLCWEALMVM